MATFSGLALNGVNGNVYTLAFSGDSLTSVASSNITVSTGAATSLVFTTQPVAGASGAAFSTQPVIKVEDSGGNVVTSSSQTITLVASGGTLASCSGLTASSGVINVGGCTFAGTVGTNYTLTAQITSAPMVSGTSGNFSPTTFGAPAKLVFTQSPSNSTGGVAFGTQPKVTVEDAGGNTVTTDSSTVALAIGTNAGPGGTLSGCTQSGETSGVVSFSGCKIDKAGTGYTLTATDAADGLNTASTPSNTFNITVGAPSTLTFSTEPSSTATSGTAFAQQPQVTVKDAGGNLVQSSSVTLAVTSGSGGGAGGTLSCTNNTVSSNSSGVAVFAGCSINTASSTAYTLTATDGVTATSTGITVSSSVSATVLAQSASSPTTNVTTANGSTDLILVYVQGSSGTPTASVATGTGTPFSAQSTIATQGMVTSGSSKDYVIAIQATGNGSTHAVAVTNTGTLEFVDVLQLSSGTTVKATKSGPSSDTSSTTATATLTSPIDSEIVFVGLNGNSGSDTISPPAGMSALGSYQSASFGGDVGMYFDSTAQSTANFTLSPSGVNWGTIAVEVG